MTLPWTVYPNRRNIAGHKKIPATPFLWLYHPARGNRGSPQVAAHAVQLQSIPHR